ncbi:MAG: class I SAM-dependent methyltransferase [Anaerolineales bacterium]|nr:class I SAM-dependent methyltransferase [Anaerolineales bacterium]
MPELKREEILSINQKGWNEVASIFYGETALPKYGPLASTENELNLIQNLDDKRVLELGCGSGHTLAYLWEKMNASELWGLDFSEEQIRFAKEFLDKKSIPAKLFIASMDENPGIPEDCFDLVMSIYSLGWTPDLPHTLALVYSYLKPGGIFIFSWEHPVYQCLDYNVNIGKYVFERSYLEEGPTLKSSWKGVEIVINHRKLSTYINAVIQSGLVIENVIESEPNFSLALEQDFSPDRWYSIPQAQLMPTTFIVKAYKPK